MGDAGTSLDVGRQLAARLMARLRDETGLPAIYPALFTGGIEEGSLHAYVLSGLVLVGDRLGYSPVCDSPIFDRLDKLLIGEGAKRPDAVWFTRGTQVVRCLVEFERYTRQSLVPKTKNLLIMGKELRDTLQLAVLMYWTYAPVPDAELQPVRQVFATGFRHPTGVAFPAPGCPALVLETLVVASRGGAAIAGFAPRLFVADGEHKRYLVEDLSR